MGTRCYRAPRAKSQSATATTAKNTNATTTTATTIGALDFGTTGGSG